jgi:hypothetical protein
MVSSSKCGSLGSLAAAASAVYVVLQFLFRKLGTDFEKGRDVNVQPSTSRCTR